MVIRPATPDDARAVATVHVRAWQAGYRDLLPADALAALRVEDRAARYTFDPDSTDPAAPYTEVADDGTGTGTIAGFVTTSLARDDDLAGLGEVCALYVDPAAWRTGVGSRLLTHAHQRLATTLGTDEAVLWVLVGNDRAEAFYRRHRWAFDGTESTATAWGIEAPERRMRRPLDRRPARDP